jgi:hypothetical protein
MKRSWQGSQTHVVVGEVGFASHNKLNRRHTLMCQREREEGLGAKDELTQLMPRAAMFLANTNPSHPPGSP